MRHVLIIAACSAVLGMVPAQAQQKQDILDMLGGTSRHHVFITMMGGGDTTLVDTTLLGFLQKNGNPSPNVPDTSGVWKDGGASSIIDLVFTGTTLRDTLYNTGFLNGPGWDMLLDGSGDGSEQVIWPIDPLPKDSDPLLPARPDVSASPEVPAHQHSNP